MRKDCAKYTFYTFIKSIAKIFIIFGSTFFKKGGKSGKGGIYIFN